jgi:hypothetical protein
VTDIALPPVMPSIAANAAPMAAVAVARLPAELAGMAAGTILQGTVIGREPGGHTVIRTPHGALVIKSGAALPMGGTVKLQLQQTGAQLQVVILSIDGGTPAHPAPAREGHVASHTQMPAQPQQAVTNDAVRMLAGHWDALAKASQLHDFVPRPAPEMAAQILALLGALRRGALSDWIGRDVQRALPEPLSAQLGADFARMARLNAADHGAWRFVPVPILIEGGLSQALLFTHGKRRRGPTAEDDAGMRILIEIETAALGKLQLDGLVQSRRFDLILRSRAVLPEAMRSTIAEIFAEAREIASLMGDISFVVGRDFIVPPVAVEAHSPGVTV